MSDPSSLHVIGSRKLGGAERFFVRLVHALHRRGFPVAVLTVGGSQVDQALTREITRYHVPMFGLWDLWSRWRIRILARPFDVVQTYLGRATRLTRLPRGRRPVHLARLGGYYSLHGYRHAHAWIGNTQGICTYLRQNGLPPHRICYIGNFVDPPQPVPPAQLALLRQQHGIPLHARVILGLGRFHPNKGFDTLLHAFARLPDQVEHRPIWLVLVGDGPLRTSLHDLAHQLNIHHRTTWAGWQLNPDPWYQLADLFVCPSRHEPLGNVILEAWAHGLPVVSTATQGPIELIEHGRTGWLVPSGDASALAPACLNVLQMNPAQRAAVAAAARDKLHQQFSEEVIVTAYVDLYRRLAAAPPEPHA